MSQKPPISPTNLFARIEQMKKWQVEHQQRLLEQQSQQKQFLSNEQRRMQQAFEVVAVEDEDEPPNKQLNINIDEIPISSPHKDFNMLLEENLNRSSSPIQQQSVRPKRPFLKKGTGLSRFKMTLKDVSSNTSHKTEAQTRGTQQSQTPQQEVKKKPIIQTKKYEEPNISWAPSKKEEASNYNSLLTELCNARQTDPELFNTPVINDSQQLFERDLLDELKLFEALEQKVSNSSFCSNSSLVQRLMEHSTKSTPQKKINFASLQSLQLKSDDEVSPLPSPKKTVYFSDKIDEETDEDDSSSISSSSDTNTSINSDDISDTPKHKLKILKRDAATNTDYIEEISTEVLKTRLEELETEIETFRKENARITKLKTQLETDSKALEKKKNQLKKEMEEEKQHMKQQLNEERTKLMKDKQVYDKYIRESREGRSLRQKDREELSVLRNHLRAVQEELKQKETKWGATHARLRNQVRQLEKENASLKIDNNELRTKNGKLEATNKQLLTRRPSDTKVLHEINKNLTKLAKDSKENKPTIPLNTSNNSSASTTQSFETIEREYEKMFGQKTKTNHHVPLSEISYNTTTTEAVEAIEEVRRGREEITLEDGSQQITYSNGNVRTISANGQTVTMKYHNGDIKESCKNSGTVRYLYADAQVWHTTYPDGLELLEFANGQVEKRFGDGSTEILFPNGCRRCTSPNGSEDVSFPDGTNLFTRPESGEKILTLPNGQKEIHTSEHKRREYPDGTVKLLYPDGIQETRYANGRIRLKDKDGNLIMDSANV